jgi:predicted small metal-binding protein|tara:strand:+ start:524 stop:790 length:267 start_codon:yes stop_codon:yes gene_type:complete
MIKKYKTHLTEMSNLKKVLEGDVKKLRENYASTNNRYELDRIANTGKIKKERLERVAKHIKECNGLLTKWDEITNDKLRELIRDGKTI